MDGLEWIRWLWKNGTKSKYWSKELSSFKFFPHERVFESKKCFLKSNIKTNNHPIYRRIVMFVTILRKRVSNKYIFNGFWSNLDLQWRWAKTVQLNTLRDRLDERWDIGKICWSFWRSVLKEKTQLGIRLMR